MPMITLFAMTAKGFHLLAETAAEHLALIHHVVIGRDSAIDNDYAATIEAFSVGNGINYVRIRREPPCEVGVRIAD